MIELKVIVQRRTRSGALFYWVSAGASTDYLIAAALQDGRLEPPCVVRVTFTDWEGPMYFIHRGSKDRDPVMRLSTFDEALKFMGESNETSTCAD